MEEFAEKDIMKMCDGKHAFCDGCFDTWVKKSITERSQNEILMNSPYDEHYCHKDDHCVYKIPHLIYTHLKCPICREENILMSPGMTANYTGPITKIIYGPLGVYKATCTYLNGRKHGLYQVFTLSGKLVTECRFENGYIQGHHICWSNGRDSQKLVDVPYTDGKIHGIARFWNAQGELLMESTYHMGEIAGSHQ